MGGILGKISTFLSLVSLARRYYAVVEDVVRYVETFKGLSGKEKKEKALKILEETLKLSSLDEEKRKNILAAISALVDLVVAVLNLKHAW